MQFKDVIGQQEVKQRLVGSVGRGRISHAQLFTGDEGVGALPLAIAYAIPELSAPSRRGFVRSLSLVPSDRTIGPPRPPFRFSGQYA